MSKTLWIVIGVIVIIGLFAVGSYNGLVGKSQAVDNAWGNVQTVYQRRADLVPNLVNTVKGAANFEQKTLTDVVNARAQATSINIDAKDLTPEKLSQFQAAQSNLSSSLGRLIAVAENYPQLTATQNFRDLQVSLEGTENRISVERKNFNDTVVSYNTAAQRFPGVLFAKLFGFAPKAYFEADAAAQVAPKVDFNTSPAPEGAATN